MSQHDMNLSNADGATFRADANNALAALVSNSSGAAAPATTFAHMWWADTTAGILKRRNAANSAWISVMDLSSGLIIGTDVQAFNANTVTVAPGTSGNVLTSTGSEWVSSASNAGGKFQDFRLTLTTGVPVTTSNVTGATTIFCTPYKGNQISLYDGAAWVTRTSAEFSLALGTLTSARPYDVFCYDNAGTPTLEFLVWTNDTTRATALAYQDGVLVKSGQATRRYLGTFYTTATTTTEDSNANRYLWNYYNRVARPMVRQETTATWTYTTATLRQANGSTSNQLNFLIGVSEDEVSADLYCMARNTNVSVNFTCGIGLDSTSVNSASIRNYGSIQVANNSMPTFASYDGIVSAGRHYLSWLEYSEATGSTTWYGQSVITQCGIKGRVMS